ncbi:hypothetical protein [Marivita lacus]|uniref:hypothetical protein n=1 Tax=Marivita lacus TaxID=1323742 RepID=UPI001667DA30|nr:hypothetical protein [Marivita lacus]
MNIFIDLPSPEADLRKTIFPRIHLNEIGSTGLIRVCRVQDEMRLAPCENRMLQGKLKKVRRSAASSGGFSSGFRANWPMPFGPPGQAGADLLRSGAIIGGDKIKPPIAICEK